MTPASRGLVAIVLDMSALNMVYPSIHTLLDGYDK